jgi:hypothetical protein
MLKSLLEVLVQWARKEHVPLEPGALAAAEAELVRPHDGLPSGPGAAILAFLKAVEVPVLVLCGGSRVLGRSHVGFMCCSTSESVRTTQTSHTADATTPPVIGTGSQCAVPAVASLRPLTPPPPIPRVSGFLLGFNELSLPARAVP